MRLTFLGAGNKRLAKTITPEKVTSYPLVKKFTSFDEEVDNIEQMALVMREHAAQGHCLLKGQLDTPLINESRKGKVDRNTPTELFVLDFDGIDLGPEYIEPEEWNEDALHHITEYLLAQLPEEFQKVSYVAQASASFGRKTSQVGLHVFFQLENFAHPQTLRDYTTDLNFFSTFWQSRLGCSATGTALTFPIDRTVVDNGRLIYIAPPKFKGEPDPCNGWDRFNFQQKSNDKLKLDSLLSELSPERTNNRVKAALRRIRRDAGLRVRRENIKSIRIGEQNVNVVMNPDRMKLNPATDEGEFVRYNVNNGDSEAYWVHKYSPDIVYNFKGEPNFSFKAADPEGYENHRVEYGIELDEAEEGATPIMFADKDTGKYYFGRYDHARKEMDYLTQMPKSTLPDFATSEGLLMPEAIDVWTYAFEPSNPITIDFKNKFLNKYIPPIHLVEPINLEDEFIGVAPGFAGEILQEQTPVIHKILSSVCGNGVTEMEYFINWLAFVVQFKRKAMTAWVFHGVPGTGKGLLYHYVLSPLLGEKYVQMKRQQDIEEKFNAWMEYTLMFIVDEFRVENAQRGSQNAITNKLKNMITETKGTIRSMGTDQLEKPLYSNMIFFSNDRDAVRIQEGDRRFNVAPRQEMPIIKRYPELFEKDVIKTGCRRELPFLSAFLMNYEVDENAVILPLENDAKRAMQNAAFTAPDEFVDALTKGTLDYFIPILEETLLTNSSDYLIAAKNIVLSLINNYNPGQETRMFMSELRPLYNVLCGKAENEHRFSKLLTRHGLEIDRIRRDGINRRGIVVKWKLKHNSIEDIRAQFTSDQVARSNVSALPVK